MRHSLFFYYSIRNGCDHMNKASGTKLMLFIGSAELTGFISSLITGFNSFSKFFSIYRKPPLLPPAWLFPVVWVILYAVMGTSAFLIYETESDPALKKQAFLIYWGQLAFNFSWSIFFFRAMKIITAGAVILTIIILCFLMILSFRKINRTAGNMNIPYLLWLLFAAYLNTAVIILS